MLNPQIQTRKYTLSFATASLLTAASLLPVGLVLYVWLKLATHSMFYLWTATAAFAAFFALIFSIRDFTFHVWHYKDQRP